MDQNSDNGTDKRSWRERLGIGAGKDMPRIADEFVPAAPAAKAAVRPAPMAPRPGVKAAPPRAAAAAPAPEKLAEKLKSQRDAQERLAEQRVQAARQRAEIKPSETTNGSGNGSKPKFTFAVEETSVPAKTALPVPPMPQPRSQTQGPPVVAKPAVPSRTVVPPPVINTPAMTPPRQPFGNERPVVPQRPVSQPPVMPTRPQQRFTPPPARGGYSAQGGFGSSPTVPPYRPIEPNSRGYGGGYAPPPAYVPPVGGYNSQPRLNVPPATLPGGAYGADNYDTRARNLRPPARPGMNYRDDYAEADVFADPRGGPRRATAGDYSQAYRDEQGYEEDLPPSRGPWMPLLLLMLLALAAGGGVWWMYQNAGNVPAGGQSTNAPVVEAPAQSAKVTPEPAQQPLGQPTKKLIYDRIVGDREVLGGDVIQSEEVPVQPGDATNLQDGDPAVAPDGTADPLEPTGQEDLVPLPLPPPPGEDGTGDQQGAAPGNKTSNEAMIQPAASESQAAVPSQAAVQNAGQKSDSPGALVATKSELPVPPAPASAEAAPVPGETKAAAAATGAEVISDSPPAEPEPAPVVEKKVAEPAATPKKVVAKKAEKSLGSEPVVLVPPADGSAPLIVDQQVASIDTDTGDGGLYGGDTIVDPGPATAVAPTPAPAPVKKKKTLADLFRGEADDPPAASIDDAVVAPSQPTPAKKIAAAPQPVPAPQPAPQQPAPLQQASAGGYVVQLASFPNQSDASKEYGRLKAKHGVALSGLSPIVTQAIVGGSTRYRLAVGVLASREQANAVCSRLFAAGERDCLVRRQ